MAVGRAGVSPVMVGRRAELERLTGRIAQSPGPAGDPEVVLVSGEAGVGKTRLTQELVRGLPPGTPVLWAEAEQGSLGRPYSLLQEAVAETVAGWEQAPDELASRADALAVLLGPVAPRLPAPADRAYSPEELLRAAVDLVRSLTGTGVRGEPPLVTGVRGEPPLVTGVAVVVFEDLQWADAESLACFSRLALATALPVLLVGTYRAEDRLFEHKARRELSGMLAELERRRRVERVDLRRLDRAEVAELLHNVCGCPVPLASADAVHERTGGNPFFIEELVAGTAAVSPDDLADVALPASLTEAVMAHLDGLSPRERSVLDAAAVLGQRIPFDTLSSLTGLSEDELIAVLQTLVGRGLLAEETADVFSFRHALTREGVASRLLGRERRRLHEKALSALQEAGSGDFAALAHHAAEAGRWDDVVAAAKAGAAAYLRAGATLQARALAELGLTEAGEDLELLELAARAAWSVGLRRGAIERAEQWRDLAAAGGLDRSLFEALRVLSRLRYEEGDEGRQAIAAREALAVAERIGPSAELAAAYNLIAETTMLGGGRPAPVGEGFGVDAALPWSRKARELADQVGASWLRPAILVNEGSALVELAGQRELGAARLEDGIAAGLAEGDDLAVIRGLHNLIISQYLWWPPERTLATLERLHHWLEQTGRVGWEADHASLMANFLVDVAGDLPAARAVLAGLRRGPEEDPKRIWWALLLEVILAVEAGEDDEAARLLKDIGPTRKGAASQERRLTIEWIGAELAAREGDAAKAERHLRTMAADLAEDTAERGWTSEAFFRGALAAVAAGVGPPVVRSLLDDALTDRLRLDVHHDPTWFPHLDGALAEASGDPAAAAAAYRDALVPADGRHRPPFVRADAHLGLARALAATDQGGAVAAAEAAVALLERWPGWRRAEAEALVAALAAPAPASPSAAGDTPLTAREREVAALVAEGLSNAEVGRRLFISTKTASVHVSNILAKLDMTSRAEIAAWAVRSGLTA